ncbi:MAG: hypothetical protein ACLFOY_11275 [Desulfatibacillaceae bacterium]
MLDLLLIFDSSVEDVIGFKCCNLPDQNLELHVRNTGQVEVHVAGEVDFEDAAGKQHRYHLYPPWKQKVAPGAAAAFYCGMDEATYSGFVAVSITDEHGRRHRFPINSPDGVDRRQV